MARCNHFSSILPSSLHFCPPPCCSHTRPAWLAPTCSLCCAHLVLSSGRRRRARESRDEVFHHRLVVAYYYTHTSLSLSFCSLLSISCAARGIAARNHTVRVLLNHSRWKNRRLHPCTTSGSFEVFPCFCSSRVFPSLFFPFSFFLSTLSWCKLREATWRRRASL